MSKNTNLSFLTDYITADITNGRIGINTPSPTVAFDVTGATKITGVLTLTSTISNGTYAYTLPSATGTLALTSAISGTTNYVAKFTSSTGIGNSNIQDSGSVVGVNTSNLLTWYSGGYMAMQFGGMAGLLSNTSNTSVTGAFGLSYNLYTDSAGNYQYMNTTGARAGSIINLEGGNIYFSNAPAGTGANPTVTERMRITSAGNVGIGTTTPSNKLEVIGASGVDNFILSGGGPGATLGGFKFGNGTGVYGSLYFSNVTNDVTLFQQYVSGNLILGTNTTERMRILSGGNVLIGTTSDNGNKLQVSGSISASVVNSTFKSYTGSITLASNQTGTIYTMGTMGLYTVQAVYPGAAINFSASAIFYAHSPYGGYVKCLDLYDGANIYLSNSGSAIQVRNDGYATYVFDYSILFQPQY